VLWNPIARRRQAVSDVTPYFGFVLTSSSGVMKIVQVQGTIVTCAAASAGDSDYSQEDREGVHVAILLFSEALISAAPLPPDNNAGTLVVLHHDRCKTVSL
jgi:hypothetical protein